MIKAAPKIAGCRLQVAGFCDLGVRAQLASSKRQPSLLEAFTLLEIMVVVAIMGIVMGIAIPTIYQQLHPESMRKAVSDVMEACSHARARAILNGAETDLVIHPADRQFEVVGAASRPAPEENRLFSPDVAGNDWRTPPRPVSTGGGSEGAFAVKLSDKIIIEGMGINGEDYTEDEIGRVRFYPNGTSDELSIVLLSDKGERRNITLEVVTGMPDVEVDPNKFRAR
jgi:prepilin-type N-terminal cleavage/methylation domain-containing protein